MKSIGTLNLEIYRCISKNITTTEVIITDKQIEHIKERHPNDYEQFSSFLTEIVASPDYIIESDRPHTAILMKEVYSQNKYFKVIVRLATIFDPITHKNSIITFLKIREKEWKRLLKNKQILYKKSSLC